MIYKIVENLSYLIRMECVLRGGGDQYQFRDLDQWYQI